MAVTTTNVQFSPRRMPARHARRWLPATVKYAGQAIRNAIGPIFLLAGLLGIFVLQGMFYVHVWRLPL